MRDLTKIKLSYERSFMRSFWRCSFVITMITGEEFLWKCDDISAKAAEHPVQLNCKTSRMSARRASDKK
jgi:hypothetical protein